VTLQSALSVTGVTTVQAGTAAAPAITTTGDTNTGIFFPAADTIAFTEGGAEAMRIDSSGNVGIGTSSPSRKFVVSNAGAAGLEIGPGTGPSSGNEYLNYNRSTSLYIPSSAYASTHTFYAGTAGGTRAVDIDSSGNLLVGTTSSIGSAGILEAVQTTSTGNAVISADAQAASYAYNVVYLNTTRAASTAFSFIRCTTSAYSANQFTVGGTGVIFSAALAGGATTLSVNASAEIIRTPSDASLKTNVQPITYGLDTVMKFKPIKHEWVESINMGAPSIGFIAQDMELEVPEVVSGEEYKSIDYPKLTAVLTKAIQEQQALITTLTDRITALENN
jgi:hypothetical protein